MAANFPTKLLMRFGELAEGQGYDADKHDFSSLPGPNMVLNPVSVTQFEDSLPERTTIEVLPGLNGGFFANNESRVRGARKVKLSMAVHESIPAGAIPKDAVEARNALDELNYWLYGNARESKFHIWDTRHVKYFAAGVKTSIMPGLSANAFEVDADLTCGDPFMYANHSEGGQHAWSYTTSDVYWGGSTTGRSVGDEVVYPAMSVVNTNATITLTTGFKLTHLGTGREFAYIKRNNSGTGGKPHLKPGEQFYVDFSNMKASIDGNTIDIKATGSLWLVPDGMPNQFRLEPYNAPTGTEPPAEDIVVNFVWVPRFQI